MPGSAARVVVQFKTQREILRGGSGGDEQHQFVRLLDEFVQATGGRSTPSTITLARAKLLELATIVDEPLPEAWDGLEIRRALDCVSAVGLDDLDALVEESLEIEPTLADPRRAFTIDTVPALDASRAGAFAGYLRGWPIVRNAWTREQRLSGPLSTEGDARGIRPWHEIDCCPRQQRHQAEAPLGLGIQAVWKNYGARGAKTRLIDIEAGWDEPLHDGLAVKHIELLPIAEPLTMGPAVAHGTGVLGLILARPSPPRISGIAPEARVLLVPLGTAVTATPSDKLNDLTCAIFAVLLRRRDDLNRKGLPFEARADVLLIEDQLPSMAGPVEVDPLVFEAIRYANVQDLVVIEPAGNGGRSIDPILQPGDSGAIIVGALQEQGEPLACGPTEACWPLPNPDPPFTGHKIHDDSNFGCRVTCYAPGTPTLTLGRVVGGGKKDLFATIGLTSAAGAIVAGAILLLQSSRLASDRDPLPAAGVPDLLRETGTPLDLALPDGSRCAEQPWMPDLLRAVR